LGARFSSGDDDREQVLFVEHPENRCFVFCVNQSRNPGAVFVPGCIFEFRHGQRIMGGNRIGVKTKTDLQKRKEA
jgi:hypothetical protein